LRLKEAPLGWRALQIVAVGRAYIAIPKKQASPISEEKQQLSDQELAHTPKEQMDIVQHLINTLKLDINVQDQPLR
jgi:hypothetical protein